MIKRIFQIITCFIAWLGIFLSFYNALTNSNNAVLTIVDLLSYFTILSNILLAICMTFIVFKPLDKISSLEKIIFLGSLVNITITSIVYHFLLAALYKPSGISYTTDLIMHYVIAGLYIINWLFFVRGVKLKYKYVFLWLLFPAIYLIYTLIRGSIINYYPYPFLNLSKLTILDFIRNVLLIGIGFVFVGSTYVFINKKINKN